MQYNDIDQRKVYKVVISLMITIAQSLERKNEKASFLGLASFNSPLKQFFFLDQDWENLTAF